MKVLLINGSPNVHGCTARALEEVAKTLEEEGIETETIQVGSKAVRGCIACGYCRSHEGCVINDIVNEVAPKFAEADGLIVGSPVYYAGPNATLTAFLDRLFHSTVGMPKRFKVGAAIVSSRRAGDTATFDRLNKYFTIAQMPIVSSIYWNNVHGFTAEDVEKDLEGLLTMRYLARNTAFLIKSIALGKEQIGLPQEEKRVSTHFMDGK